MKKRPILLIPGSNGKQQYFYTLAKKLSETNLGPVFSLDLQDPYPITKRDVDAVKKRIEEIKELYQKSGYVGDLKIDIVGYSRGAMIGKFFVVDDQHWGVSENDSGMWTNENIRVEWASNLIGRCIQLGKPVNDWWKSELAEAILDKLYDLDGEEDLVVKERSTLKEDHRFEVSSGHLGLLQNADAHKKIIEWLSY